MNGNQTSNVKYKKSKFSNCIACPLYEQDLIIGETNCHDNIKDVDLLVFGEAPALEEVRQGRPLVGRAGKVFRRAFEQSNLKKCNYYITNIVLCSNLDEKNRTKNPPDTAIDFCKVNWLKLLEILNPKVILLMGNSTLKSFGFDTSISKVRGRFLKYKNYTIFPTYHPSFIMRNGSKFDEGVGLTFLNDFRSIYKYINNHESMNYSLTTKEDLNKKDRVSKGRQDNCYSITIDDKYYSKEYSLIDVQHIYRDKSVVYIFRKSDGSREYLRVSNDLYYYYHKKGNPETEDVILNVNDVSLIEGYPNDVSKPNDVIYEGDISVDLKHSIDYRYLTKNVEKDNIPLKKLYMDIEVYRGTYQGFPLPKDANFPINAISYKIHGNKKTYVSILDLNDMDKSLNYENGNEICFYDLIKNNSNIDISKLEIENPENVIIKVFNNEVLLLTDFAKFINDEEPDIISGWNSKGFDYPYIFNRMKNKLNMDINIMSPLNFVHFNEEYLDRVNVYGTCMTDMMELLQIFTQNNIPTYKLDYVAKEYLGKNKVSYEGQLDDLYRDNIIKFIEYSAVDSTLLEELENKLQNIDLMYELIQLCGTVWNRSTTTLGRIDPLLFSYAKSKNLVCKNKYVTEDKVKQPGAFVRPPIKGIHQYVIDFDFSSLYPSIICSLNLDTMTYIAKIDTDVAYNYINNKPINNTVDIIYYPTKNKVKKRISKENLYKFIENNEAIVSINGTIFKGHDQQPSFIGDILRDLMGTRKVYKNKMFEEKDESLKSLYKNRQLTYKIAANSIFGGLGNVYFRFFNIDLFKTITLTGQEVSKFAQYYAGRYMKYGSIEYDSDYSEKVSEPVPYTIYGDTDSIFLGMYEYLVDKNITNITVDTILKHCKKIQDFLNNTLLMKFADMHNIKHKYNLFNLKQELIADRGYFFDVKKMYGLHIINIDGKEVDQLEIMGGSVKRSEFPSYTREVIKKILTMILTDEVIDFNKINTIINEYSKIFMKKCMDREKDIAKIASFKKDLSEYKNKQKGLRYPPQVEGMLLWNELEYEYFIPSTKGYLYYIKGIDEDKAPEKVRNKKDIITSKDKCIVIPYEEERLPEYYIIDVDQQYKYSWEDRINDLLRPIYEEIYETDDESLDW